MPTLPAAAPFCEAHRRLRCQLCAPTAGASRRPVRGNLQAWDLTWHATRAACHARIRRFLEVQHGRPWSEALYWEVFDRPTTGLRDESSNEDLGSFSGAFCRAMLKMVDLTLYGRRIQDYGGEQKWAHLRSDLFETHMPHELAEMIADRRLRIHGGNGAWSAQQRAPHLLRSPLLRETVDRLVFGRNGGTPDTLSDAAAAARIADVRKFADGRDIKGVSIPFCSKVFHIFDPLRWPVLNTRANADIAAEAGDEVAKVRSPDDYVEFAHDARALAREKRLTDLGLLDIRFSHIYRDTHGAKIG